MSRSGTETGSGIQGEGAARPRGERQRRRCLRGEAHLSGLGSSKEKLQVAPKASARDPPAQRHIGPRLRENRE